MDYSSRIHTSLDLNTNPLRLLEEIPQNKEAPGNFLELGRKSSVEEEAGVLVEELNRVSAENKKLTEILTDLCENYDALRNHVIDYVRKCQENELSQSKKRKSDSSNNYLGLRIDGSNSSDEESCKKPREEINKAKITNVYVKTDASDTSLVLKDGYQWRKYGQKVTRDNPCPRGYFKCSFAPSCPVKKKVQRSVEDQSVLVATYEGEHNHPPPSQLEATSGSASLAKSILSNTNEAKSSRPTLQSHQFHPFLVDQMASSLTKDPNFTAALATAISGQFSG